MNLNHLRTFRAVARTHSFTRAAAQLGVTQPAVSMQVRQLEQELGITLVQVLGRRVQLTDAGRLLLEYADRIFRLADEASERLEEMRGLRGGHLQVGASTTPGVYLLPAAIGQFKERHPDVDVALAIGNSGEIQARLARYELHVGVIGGGLSTRGELTVELLARDRLAVVVPPDHPLAGSRDVPPDRVLEYPLILREPGSNTRRVFEERLRRLGLTARVAMEIGDTEAIKQAVAARLGIAVLSRLAVTWEVACGRLALAGAPELEVERPLNIVYPKGKRLSPAEEAFLQELRNLSRAADRREEIPAAPGN